MQQKEKFKPKEEMPIWLDDVLVLQEYKKGYIKWMKHQKVEGDLEILLNNVINYAKLQKENEMKNIFLSTFSPDFSSPKPLKSSSLSKINKIPSMVTLKNKQDPMILLKNKFPPFLSPRNKHSTTEPYTPTPFEEVQMFTKIKDTSTEHQMIETYLKKYTNLDLDYQITECISTAQKKYELEAIRLYPNTLTSMLGILRDQEYELISLLKNHYIGQGSYGFVLGKTKEFPQKVAKISYGTDLSVNYDPLEFKEMPFEYCVGLLSPTTHLLKPIPDSFQPIQLPQFLFQSKLKLGHKIRLKFEKPSILPSMPIKDIPVVPMFEMPLCEEVNWKEVIESKTVNSVFLELLHGLNEVHESGISINDIAQRNLMFCDGSIKFIDLGFATLYSKVKETLLDEDFQFGNTLYRSPWAHVVSGIPKQKLQTYPYWNLQEKLVLELIANDFWSLAAVFGHGFCELGATFDHLESIMVNEVRPVSFPNTEEINKMVQTNLKTSFNEIENNSEILSKCPKSLQAILKSILQSDPIARMKNVEDMLQIRRTVMAEHSKPDGKTRKVIKLKHPILQTRIKEKYKNTNQFYKQNSKQNIKNDLNNDQ